jgi:flavin reductase (DIM6/NTAB) family NADH-FMN oxidoreductase RutF
MNAELSKRLQTINEVVGRADRAIWIATAAHAERRSGLVATWVASASVDPEYPLVMAGLAPNHYTCELVRASKAFGLHLVGENSVEKAFKFCLSSGRVENKFSGLACDTGETGSPLLRDCLGWLDCRVIDSWDVGDRVFFIAEPVAARNIVVGRPATEADLIAAANPLQRAQLIANREADVRIQRPLRAAWRGQIGVDPGAPN